MISHVRHPYGLERATLAALPCVEARNHRALVGLILGPAASWVHARELVRSGKIRRLGRALSIAWRRTFSRGIRLEGVPGLREHAQAVFVRPAPDHLDIAAINAREWRAILSLGWEWLTGDWVAAEQVTHIRATRFGIAGRKPVLALFDGEPVMLDPGVTIGTGTTRKMFVTTMEAAA